MAQIPVSKTQHKRQQHYLWQFDNICLQALVLVGFIEPSQCQESDIDRVHPDQMSNTVTGQQIAHSQTNQLLNGNRRHNAPRHGYLHVVQSRAFSPSGNHMMTSWHSFPRTVCRKRRQSAVGDRLAVETKEKQIAVHI